MFEKRLPYSLILLICLFVVISASAQDFTTLTYYQDDSVELALDLFPSKINKGKSAPLLIYVHGGGFAGGNREAGHNLAKYLSKKGYTVASISYSLYMKNKSFSCDGILSEKIKAIQIAVNQLWLATAFMLYRAKEYNIDKSKLFIAGSSAGAETVLHAAFWDREQMALYEHGLPKDFTYAGLIAGAGAIMDLNLISKQKLIPIMMFHGNNDPLVPYGTAAHHFCSPNDPGWLMLFGSYAIYKHLLENNGDVMLISYCGGKHNYAGQHFFQEQEPVYDFLEKVVGNTRFQHHDIRSTPTADQSPEEYFFCK